VVAVLHREVVAVLHREVVAVLHREVVAVLHREVVAVLHSTVFRTWMEVCVLLSIFQVSYFLSGSTAPWGPIPPYLSMLQDHTQTLRTR
jgi:hypothetical protein